MMVAVGLALFTTGAARATQGVVYGPPAEGAKVILGDTSIDGPAIARTYSPKTMLAWTGTDPDHHLNVMFSSDGLHYSDKHILPETSLWRPAMAFIDSGRGDPYFTIVLAWTGTDAAHTLNLEFIAMPDFTVTEKTIFWGETSFTAPSVTTINGDVNSDVYLAWSGTDAAHSLNVIHHTTAVPQQNVKQTLWGWKSISRPNISRDPSPGTMVDLILAWTSPDNHLAFASTANRTHWTMPGTSPLALQSAWAPSMIAFFTSSMPTHWLAWTGSGTKATQQITVRYTESFPAWGEAGSSTTLGETAISSPALAYAGNGAGYDQMLLAWTGTDPDHHLNVAVIK
jgi:hypothetical protein